MIFIKLSMKNNQIKTNYICPKQQEIFQIVENINKMINDMVIHNTNEKNKESPNKKRKYAEI